MADRCKMKDVRDDAIGRYCTLSEIRTDCENAIDQCIDQAPDNPLDPITYRLYLQGYTSDNFTFLDGCFNLGKLFSLNGYHFLPAHPITCKPQAPAGEAPGTCTTKWLGSSSVTVCSAENTPRAFAPSSATANAANTPSITVEGSKGLQIPKNVIAAIKSKYQNLGVSGKLVVAVDIRQQSVFGSVIMRQEIMTVTIRENGKKPREEVFKLHPREVKPDEPKNPTWSKFLSMFPPVVDNKRPASDTPTAPRVPPNLPPVYYYPSSNESENESDDDDDDDFGYPPRYHGSSI